MAQDWSGIPHFVVGHVDDDLIERFFVDGDRVEVRKFKLGTKMNLLAREAGCFASSADAERNGFKGPVEVGIRLCGTKKHPFWVWSSPLEGERDAV